jgi:RNA polymerase sigma-70 factor (ECF subfamily)
LTDDRKIVIDCLSGNIDQYKVLVNKYQTTLARTAYYFLGSWNEAEDATQETFVKAYLALKTFDTTRSFSSWLTRILINECKDRLKASRRRFHTSINQPIEDKNAAQKIENIAQKELIMTALNQLPLKRRQVIILVDIEGRTSKQTAELLNRSESTIRVTLMKARQQLRTKVLQLLDE